MIFSHEFRVRFGAVDHARVVYYPRFFDYFHRTFEEWFGAALGASYDAFVNDDNLGFPSVTAQAEFLAPVRFGERLRIDLEVVDVGRRSLTVRYTGVRLPDGETAVRATVKKAMVDHQKFVAVDIPEVWRRRFQEFKEKS
jgi:4-hydroxybenzoyl-CoA thioesterase